MGGGEIPNPHKNWEKTPSLSQFLKLSRFEIHSPLLSSLLQEFLRNSPPSRSWGAESRLAAVSEPSPREKDLGHTKEDVVKEQGVGKADFHLLEQLPAPTPTSLVAKSTDCQEDKNPRLHLEPPSLSPSL